MKMKTIRVIGIALSMVAILLVAMAPPASATCSPAVPSYYGKFKGSYSFRLGPAKGFDADLANNGDPGQVSNAGRQDIVRVGTFYADGCGNISLTGPIAPAHTLATTDTNSGDTWLINFTWTGAYTVNPDLTGTLTITPTEACTTCTLPIGTSPCCYDETTLGPACTACVGNEENTETYSISISASNGRVELSETDNSFGQAKIFMIGEAIKQ